jgi:hypothetical protein
MAKRKLKVPLYTFPLKTRLAKDKIQSVILPNLVVTLGIMPITKTPWKNVEIA